jgi:hypothetical protein
VFGSALTRIEFFLPNTCLISYIKWWCEFKFTLEQILVRFYLAHEQTLDYYSSLSLKIEIMIKFNYINKKIEQKKLQQILVYDIGTKNVRNFYVHKIKIKNVFFYVIWSRFDDFKYTNNVNAPSYWLHRKTPLMSEWKNKKLLWFHYFSCSSIYYKYVYINISDKKLHFFST